MARNVVELGAEGAPIWAFSETDYKDLKSLSFVSDADVSGTQLAIDTLTPSVFYPYNETSGEIIGGVDFYGVLSSDGYFMGTNKEFFDIRALPYGTPIRYYRDGALYSRMYLKSVDRVSTTCYRINAISAIGLLAEQKHPGGIYRGTTFYALAKEIIGTLWDGLKINFDSDELKTAKVYGYLPYQSRRDALHMLLSALGIVIRKGKGWDMYFCYPEVEKATQIGERKVYTGGTVDYSSPVTAVNITEHSYFALSTDEEVTVYDNTDGSETANNTLVVFTDAPLHDLSTSGNLRIVESHVNYAVISGTGALSGKKYTHSTRVLTKHVDGSGDLTEKVASVENNTLVNVLNSENVAARVLAYYSSKRTVSLSFVNSGEKCGDMITGIDAYGDEISGFIVNLNGTVSNIIKTTGKVITDYVPAGNGNNYTKSITLTGTGTWTIPAEVFAKDNPIIQVILIGGGSGGASGEAGGEGTGGGTTVFGAPTQAPGAGGAGGAPGQGGKIFSTTIHVTGLTSFSYHGGARGSSDSEGGDTTFGEYSSATGARSETGITNTMTGEIVGKPGAAHGIAGGAGSGEAEEGPSLTYGGQTWTPGARGATDTYSSGRVGYGGYGGGAAVGSNGGAGRDGSAERDDGEYYCNGGRGGDGATPDAPDPASGIGEGGAGGHGGGGAGEGGKASGGSSNGGTYYGSPGTPGAGGRGGAGGPGGIIVYY